MSLLLLFWSLLLPLLLYRVSTDWGCLLLQLPVSRPKKPKLCATQHCHGYDCCCCRFLWCERNMFDLIRSLLEMKWNVIKFFSGRILHNKWEGTKNEYSGKLRFTLSNRDLFGLFASIHSNRRTIYVCTLLYVSFLWCSFPICLRLYSLLLLLFGACVCVCECVFSFLFIDFSSENTQSHSMNSY